VTGQGRDAVRRAFDESGRYLLLHFGEDDRPKGREHIFGVETN
jgi:hypothetical protein